MARAIKGDESVKTYYVDYKGMIDPANNGREHIGLTAIPGPGGKKILLLRPGLQEIKPALWHAVRGSAEIGWDDASKSYSGTLVQRGAIRVYESKDGAMDWAAVGGGLDDLSRRTTIVPVLKSMLEYVESRPGLAFVASRLRTHIEECSTDFDGKPVPEDRLVPRQEVA